MVDGYGAGCDGEENAMTPTQITLVQTSFAQVRAAADTVAEQFYQRLFELDPSVRRLFPADMREQRRLLMTMLARVVNDLQHFEALKPLLEQLGQRHVGYGVHPSHYATVGQALLWTLQQGLGPQFTAELEAAWVAAYTQMVESMAVSLEPADT